jgi:hypothetical protein
MLLVNEILHKWGNTLVERLKNDIKSKPITKYGAANASGKLYNSISYEVDERGLRILAFDYAYFIEFGRGPTKSNGTGELRPKIRQWIDDKGIVPDGITKDSLAYLITRKIHREGTEIFKQGGTTLLRDIFNDRLVSDIQSDIALSFQDAIITNIRSELLKIAA